MRFADLKMFVRNLFRNKLYSVITVVGFAVSLTFVILLSVYIRQELSVDQFQENKDRIFRARGEDAATWGALVGEQLKNAIPDIEAYTRIYANNESYAVNAEGNKLTVKTLYVDEPFLDMFTFPFREGRNFKAKKEVVISLSFARKMFGDESPLGKDLNMNGESGWTIVGVVDDFPENTQIRACDALVNFNSMTESWINNNNSSAFTLYLLAREGTDLPSKVPVMLDQMKKDFWMYRENYRKEIVLEPLSEVYWSPYWSYGMQANSRMFVGVLTAIVVVILILALINYNNLSVARAGFRAKESAVKKLLGSNSKALFIQYITESVILCLVAFFLSIFLALGVLPWFNSLLNTHLVLAQHITWATLAVVLLGIILIGVIAGLTPALIITRFNPVDVMKGAFRKKAKGVYSKVLISFQYCVTITLIICALVIWKQTDFMRTYDLGFNKENVVWLESKVSGKQQDALRNELSRIPGVQLISFTRGTPLDGGNNQTMDYGPDGKQISFQQFVVDSNFFKILGIQVISKGTVYDPRGVWLSETAVKAIGAEGIPDEFMYYEKKLPVLGIFKDFHIEDLTEGIDPVFISVLEPGKGCWSVLVKVGFENPVRTFDQIKKVYSRFIEGIPFESGFMDKSINDWYEEEARTARLIGYFSILAIVLSTMGILAMATYFIQQRVKEIGVRRVNGATVNEILCMLMGSFMKWIVLAFVIASPLAWYVMSRWLQDFPYQTDISWWLFAGAGLMAVMIAALMVGGQSIRAASENPVKALQNE